MAKSAKPEAKQDEQITLMQVRLKPVLCDKDRRGSPTRLSNRLSTPICKYLRGVPSFDTAHQRRIDAFRHAMRGRQYGQDETIQAWVWFDSGYGVGWCDGELVAYNRAYNKYNRAYNRTVAKRQKKGDTHGEVIG